LPVQALHVSALRFLGGTSSDSTTTVFGMSVHLDPVD
jgi:hypothetical protein